jgi:phosphomevalonate kinase
VAASAPGKLFVAGEWGVLSGRCPAIVYPANRRAHVRVWRREDELLELISVNSGLTVKVRLDQGRAIASPVEDQRILDSIFGDALRGALAALSKIESRSGITVSIDTRELNFEDRKLGLGSSAATVAAIVKAIFEVFSAETPMEVDRDCILRLAVPAHSRVSGRWCGSGADVACAVYDRCIYFRNRMISNESSAEGDAAGLEVEEICWPDRVQLIAAWCGRPSVTRSLIEQFGGWRLKHEGSFSFFSLELAGLIAQIRRALVEAEFDTLRRSFAEHHRMLIDLGRAASLPIVTKELARIVEIAEKAGAAAKTSGAGGGDCVIALASDSAHAAEIVDVWRTGGVTVLEL